MRGIQGIAAGGLMTLAMASIGDLVSPRERGRYQGYIAATFAAATVLGPLVGGLLVQGPGWRWVFYVNLPVSGAALLAGATTTFMLACVWGGERYAWDSPAILSLIGATVLLGGALVARERRAQDPIVPFALLRTRSVAVASTALFLGTAALFSVTVFVPLFLQTATGATPTEAGLLLAPMMLGTTVSTVLSGRYIARTGRYKRFPIAGLGLMASALVLLAVVTGDASRTATGIGLVVFGLGFGMVTQVLIVAVQNSVDRRELGVATAATGFFRALGGAVGAATLGAVFAAHAGSGLRSDIVDAVQLVFAVAAPLAAIALLVVLRLPERALRS
jgi:MFS family permease